MSRRSALLVGVVLGAVGAVTVACSGVEPLPTPSTTPSATPSIVPDVGPAVDSSLTYRAVRPARVVNTRTGLGGSAVPARGARRLLVTGRGGVPADAAAVAANVTVVPRATGSMTVYPAGQPNPATSSLHYVAGRPVGNHVVGPPGANGAWTFTNSARAKVDVIIDIEGYFVRGPAVAGGFVPLAARRVMDTRIGLGGATPRANSTVDLQLTGRGGIPSTGVSAVMLNVTAADPKRFGRLIVYPSGTTPPGARTVSFNTGATVTGFALTKVGTDGRVRIANRSYRSTPVVVDVTGYVLAGRPTTRGAYVAVAPTRVVDTMFGYGVSGLGSTGLGAGEFTPTDDISVPVPAGPVEAYALTATAYFSKAPSYLAVSPAAMPRTSTVQHRPGLNASGAAFGRTLTVYNHAGWAGIFLDLSGYFLGADLIATGLATLVGQVSSERGDGLAMARVAVFREGASGNGQPVAQIRTDSAGHYALDVAPGRYLLCFDGSRLLNASFRAECFDDRPWRPCARACPPPRDSAVVPVAAGSVTRLDVSLAKRS
jgi:hypothetical protein